MATAKLDLEKAQTTGCMIEVEYSDLATSVGKSIFGLGLGSLEVIKLARETTDRQLKFLEVGPGNGVLVPEILKAHHEMQVIGEGHHID